MKLIVYALIDPRTSLTRYIGKSSTGMKRPRNHVLASRLRRDRSHKANWIRELLAAGLAYTIVILEQVEDASLLDASERRWIAHGRAQAWPLTNLTEGGDGPTEARPKVVREKIREACRRPEAIAKMSAANKGRVRTLEHQEKLATAIRGRKHTPEARAKMSATRTGIVFSPDHRASIAASKLGKPRPDVAARNASPEGQQQTAKLHEMARGRPRPDLAERNRSPEQREALSKALKGRVFSAETIERMRAGQQRRQSARRESMSVDKKPTGESS